MRRLVFDLDGTLTHIDREREYDKVLPNEAVVRKLREYKADGYEIIIQTARNMKTHGNSVGKITALTVPIVIEWLKRHDIPFDEIHVGKPWCGHEGFYIDDRAIRPDEFVAMRPDEIARMLGDPE